MKKATFSAQEFFETVKLLSSIDTKKIKNLTELWNIKISIIGTKAEFLKTDLKSLAKKSLPCRNYGDDFSFLLLQDQAENISSVFAKSKEISFEVQDLCILVTDESAKKARIPLSGKCDDFPEKRELNRIGGKVTIDNDKFFEYLEKVSVSSCGVIPTVQGFSGVSLSKRKDDFYLVATDGSRMTVGKFTTDEAFEPDNFEKESMNFLIDHGQVKFLQKLKKIGDGKHLYFFFQKNLLEIIFPFDSLTIQVTLSEGDFPDFTKYVPDMNTETENFTIEADIFDREIKSLEKIYCDNGFRILMETKDEKAEITAYSANYGEFSTKVQCASSNDMKLIGINARFLRDALSTLKKKKIAVFCEDEGMPMYITESTDRSSLVHVIMTLSSR